MRRDDAHARDRLNRLGGAVGAGHRRQPGSYGREADGVIRFSGGNVRTLTIWDRAEEPECSRLAVTLSAYVTLPQRREREGDARALEARIPAISVTIDTPATDDRAALEGALHDYEAGYIHFLAGNYAEAEPFYQRALLVQERMLPLTHEDTVRTLESYADLLRKTNRGPEAVELEIRAKDIREKHEKASHAGP